MVLDDFILRANLYELFDFKKSNTTEEKVINQINPNSIDLTLDNYCLYMKQHETLVYGEDTKNYWISKSYLSDYLVIYPNECVLCCTREYVTMPDNLCGQLFTKSTLGRMFVNHMMAGVIDAGFEGRITLEFKNDSQNIIKIPFGARVVQLVYSELRERASQPYSKRKSRYNGAMICEASKEEITYG